MRVHGYNPERKPKSNMDVYLKAVLIGSITALIVIGGGIGIKFVIKLLITYWMWLIGGIFALIILKRFLIGRKKK